MFDCSTWKTVTVAQSKESKFFLWQVPVSGSQNLHPNRFMPRILTRDVRRENISID